MWKNYLKTSLRNLQRHRLHSLILLFGLTAGLTVCILLLEYVSFELSFDRYHEKSDHIYRVINDRFQNGQRVQKGTITYPTIGPVMDEEYPEIVNHARVFMQGSAILGYEDRVERIEGGLFVDERFFEMFDVELLAGSYDGLLSQTNQIVLTEDLARRFFRIKGDNFDSVLGKGIQVDRDAHLSEVVGVCANFPANSLLQSEILASYQTLIRYIGEGTDNSWSWSDFYHYLELAPGTDVAALEEKFVSFSERHFKGEEVSGAEEKFYLQPLADAHLYSNDLEYEIGNTGSASSVWSMLIIAAFVLVLAWINYVNLSSVRAIERSREVGIRKVVGAQKRQLSTQFLIEAMTLNLFSLLLALGIATLVKPYISDWLGIDLTLDYLLTQSSLQYMLLGGMLFLFLTGIAFSGLYPAWLLSRQNVPQVIKGIYQQTQGSQRLRQGLVIFQFAASITLIVGTVLVYQQIRYMNQEDLGINIDQVIALNPPEMTQFDSTFIDKIDAFKEELEREPGIKAATVSSRVVGDGMGRMFNIRRRAEDEQTLTSNFIEIDHDFSETFQLELIAGRDFRASDHSFNGAEINSLIINEEAVEMLGHSSPEEAIDKQVHFANRYWTIIGVFPDFHQQSLHHSIEPILFIPFYGTYQQFSVRLDGGQLEQALAKIEDTYSAFFPGNVFEYEFLDEYYAENYSADQRFGDILLFFTGLALLIACLGLLGLTSYVAFLRTKEIGIRKILGASVSHIIAILTKDFMKLTLIAMFIAIPLAWYLSSQWLEGFAYHVKLQWWVFLLAGIAAVMITFITVSVQSLRAAVANPVKSLRNE